MSPKCNFFLCHIIITTDLLPSRCSYITYLLTTVLKHLGLFSPMALSQVLSWKWIIIFIFGDLLDFKGFLDSTPKARPCSYFHQSWVVSILADLCPPAWFIPGPFWKFFFLASWGQEINIKFLFSLYCMAYYHFEFINILTWWLSCYFSLWEELIFPNPQKCFPACLELIAAVSGNGGLEEKPFFFFSLCIKIGMLA